MKKIQAIIISILFLMTNNIYASLFQAPNPYSFGPEGRAVSDLRDFAKPKQMARILPNMPVVATDAEGNRVYYTPDGKMTLSVAKDGSMSFSLGGTTKSLNSDGEVTNITRTLIGSGLLQEVRNNDDEVVSYRALNGKGKVVATYDKDKNLTATYVYTGQGATLDYIQNEMTGGRTYYDDFGRTKVDVDMDGYVLKTYQYGDVSYLLDETDFTRKSVVTVEASKDDYIVHDGTIYSRKDYKAQLWSTRDYSFDINSTSNGEVDTSLAYNSSYFSHESKILYTTNSFGLTNTSYFYKNDDKGNKILDYSLDILTENKTYYDEHGNRDYIVNAKEVVITRFYDGYSVNFEKDNTSLEVTKYDIDGTELYTTLKNISYNSDGSIDKIMNEDDEVVEQYFYTTDSEGNKIIEYVKNLVEDTITYYDDQQRQTCTKDKDGKVITEFSWNGNTLVYTFDTKTQLTKYYNMDKDLVYIAFNERVISKNIYNKGQLIGKWDAQNRQVTIFINERSWISVATNEEPTADMITVLISHSTEINNDISRNESTTLDKLMKEYGWK